ncbi:50S ribosomal protein L4 [Aeromicrobium tamlense]|uniref:Large ribosomal subunit protein uL4 n=1 Tax=Aeromicrobium tamlense TaxID=375541 RepID=A0A8I0KHZ5_9ACTN|nr:MULTISPECIES: 50S ribosomal protein L4 [Aeromicrobium]MBD1269302.1 50S ribosomal protein L4 [Aeromicrobium tamlense]NYI36790.1 large subunit ribosomal protein L4 [Aeromicrobium tamlense]
MAQTIDVDLPVDIFDARVSIPLMHQVVTAQLAAARQGTHDVKSRGEVRGGGKKPYRQKGTGRARQGSIRAPQYAGGGIVHGPTPRSYDQRTPKKMKAAALRGALTDRARSGRLHVIESFVSGDAPSTKVALAAVRELTGRARVLVVVDRDDALTVKSLRNAAFIATLSFDQLNTYDVLLADDVIFTKAAFDAFVAARSAEGTDTVKLSQAVVEADAPAAKPAKKAAPKTEAKAEVADEDVKANATKTQPYGPGSKAPLASGNAPKGHEVKAVEADKTFVAPGAAAYDDTEATVWFDSAETAEAAGFTAQEEN